MKKQLPCILVAAACILLAFVLGLSLGQNHNAAMQITQTVRPLPDPTADFTLLVNINTASAEQLATLPGIGETYANRIVAFREENGPFHTVEELLLVEGIGESRLEVILDYITAGG